MQISKNKAVFGMLAKSAFSFELCNRMRHCPRGVFAYVMVGNDQNRRPQRQKQR